MLLLPHPLNVTLTLSVHFSNFDSPLIKLVEVIVDFYVYINVCLRVQYEIYFASHFIFVNYLHECVARVQIMTKIK